MRTVTGYVQPMGTHNVLTGTDLQCSIHKHALGGGDEEVDVADVALGVVLGVGHLGTSGGG